MAEPLAAIALAARRAGDLGGARAAVARLVGEVAGAAVDELRLTTDQYALNSVSGTVRLADGRDLFFKFHQEDGEEQTIAEYYNAELLARVGYRVDVPVVANGEPGRQILLYRRRDDQRMADACRALEVRAPGSSGSGDAAGSLGFSDPAPASLAELVACQEEADRLTADRLLATLHDATAEQVVAEPVHQLFSARLRGGAQGPGTGGRVAAFYAGRTFDLAGVEVPWERLRRLRWRVNGVPYRDGLGAVLADAATVLDPSALGPGPAVVAHGDDHNANVWLERDAAGPHQVLFDPAFAGAHVPALLAPVKATFHNVFAHPFWLYEPAVADERYRVSVRLAGDELVVEHDWAPGPVREAILGSKARLLWRPLLAALAAAGRLPRDWRRVVRRALACCPLLVMDLRAGGAGGHTPTTSALGLAVAVMVGSEPAPSGARPGVDVVTRWLDAIDPASDISDDH